MKYFKQGTKVKLKKDVPIYSINTSIVLQSIAPSGSIGIIGASQVSSTINRKKKWHCVDFTGQWRADVQDKDIEQLEVTK